MKETSAEPVLKQYGEIRTGTNYLRALLRRCHPELCVLSYILGDKHSPPAPLDQIWSRTRASPEADYAFVRDATYAVPGTASHDGDRTQAGQLRHRAARIAAAWRDGRLGFALSIKEPHAWVVSVARFLNWMRPSEQAAPAIYDQAIGEICRRYNRHYRAWLALAANERCACVVRFEDLLRDADAVVCRIEAMLRLPARAAYEPIVRAVAPTAWDHLPVLLEPADFDAAFYLERRYLRHLTPAQRSLIHDTIDWPLLAGLGYAPLG